MKKMLKNTGFTLIELLVIVAIIALLAGVIIASLGGAQRNAEVVQMVGDLQRIEDAMQRWSRNEGLPHYQRDNLLGTNNVPIQDLVRSTDLRNYLAEAPITPFGENYLYDNDLNQMSACGHTDGGAKIIITGIPTDIREQLNQTIDGDEEDTSCGKFTIGGEHSYYIFSRNGRSF